MIYYISSDIIILNNHLINYKVSNHKPALFNEDKYMLTYSFDNRNKKSLYEYLYTCIKDDIISGKLTPDTKLPSKRDFAKNHGISVVTVENAYGQLLAEGYIYSLPKRDFMYRRLIIITIQ